MKAQRIGRRLLVQALLLSLLLTLLLTFVQAWTAYHARIRSIHDDMEQIVNVQAKGVAISLWQFNASELASQAQGMLHYPYIRYVAVSDERGNLVVEAGERSAAKPIVRTTELTYDRKGETLRIGTLYLEANTSDVISDLVPDVLLGFLVQAVAVGVVAGFLLVLLQRQVIRHISTAAAYFRASDIAGASPPLALAKRHRHDEIDTLVDAFNALRAAERAMLARLGESEERLRVLVEHAPDAIVVYDLDLDRFVNANRNADRLFGCSRDVVLAGGPGRFVARQEPDEGQVRGRIAENIERALGGEAPVFERLIQPLDGSPPVLCEVRLVRLPSADRRLIRASLVDITERKRAEAALLAAEKRFRGLLETIQLVALMLDKAGRVTFCNDYTLSLTGWSFDEVVGADWFETFVEPGERAAKRRDFLRAIATGAFATHGETRVVTKSGAVRTVVWDHAVLHDPDGSVAGLASIGLDVTDYRSVEAQLRHSQKMEAIGHLAGGIAHDFNNVLTVTLGMSSFLLSKMAPDDPFRGMVERIHRASEQASHLTRSLLAFSRKLVMTPKDVDLNAVVTNVAGFLRRIIGEDVELVLVAKAEALPVHVDGGQFEQVLMNLATNARDAMREGGKLLITTEKVHVDQAGVAAHGVAAAGDYALMTVRDTGTGMSEEVRQRLFEPFFTTKGVGRGTGLGLSIVYGIVEQHHGHIDVTTAPGEGTAFRLFLPLVASVAPPEAAKAAEAEAPRGTETVLLVEDNEAVRQFIATVVADRGYRVLLAKDGQEAVDVHAAQKDAIDLVLMDLVMPRKSGKAAHQEMRRRQPGVKVLFMSGYTADLIQTRGELAGGTDLILKPLKPLDLLRRMRALLDRTGGNLA